MTDSKRGFAAHAVSGAAWTGLSSVSAAVAQYLQIYALSQFVTPREFGLIAVLFICYAVGMAFADGGTGNYIVHARDLSRRTRAAIFVWTVLWGSLTGLALWFGAPIIGTLYDSPSLASLIRLLAVAFIIIPPGMPATYTLQRNLRFRALFMGETAGKWSGLAVIIAGGVAGFGVQAAVWAVLIDGGVRSAIYIIHEPSTLACVRSLDRRIFLRFARFGFFQMGERLLSHLSVRLDQIIIGAMLGAHRLGLYSLAHTITVQPVQRLNPIINRVSLPLLSRVQGQAADLHRVYFSGLRGLFLVVVPALALMAALSSAYMPWIFGEQWRPAAPLVTGLCFVSLIRAITNPNGNLLLARGLASRSFVLNLSLFLAQTPLIVAGAFLWGVWGIIGALLLVQLSFLFVEYNMIMKPILGPCLRSVVATLAFPLAASMSAACVAMVTVRYGGRRFPDWAGTVSGAALGLATYVILTLVFNKEAVRSIRAYIRRAYPGSTVVVESDYHE